MELELTPLDEAHRTLCIAPRIDDIEDLVGPPWPLDTGEHHVVASVRRVGSTVQWPVAAVSLTALAEEDDELPLLEQIRGLLERDPRALEVGPARLDAADHGIAGRPVVVNAPMRLRVLRGLGGRDGVASVARPRAVVHEVL